MGCCSSKESGPAPPPNRPVDVELQHMERRPERRPHQDQNAPHRRIDRRITPAILEEFFSAIDNAFGDMEYGIIGGGAMIAYGRDRTTNDIDVIVPRDVSNVVEGHLLGHGMVRTTGGGLGYLASDRHCYGLDWSSDRDISQDFRASRDTQRIGRSRARVVNPVYLLNSKAFSYMTRVGQDSQAKSTMDAEDILFLLSRIKSQKLPVHSSDCRWVTDYDFWNTFCSRYTNAPRDLQALGLQRDATPSASNRDSIRSSISRRSSGAPSTG